MAIKGKSKTKSRPKQVARAPRREPVLVKPPLFQRRWLQLTATFVLGLFAMAIVWWVSNGISSDNAQTAAANAASTRRVAAQTWKTAVEGAFATVGTASTTPGSPPAMFPDMSTALTAMAKGQVPKGAADTFDKAGASAQTASKTLTKFAVADHIRNKGFNAVEATAFTDSQTQLTQALDLYAKAAAAATLATNATGAQQQQLVAFAQSLQTSATSQLSNAWSSYENALAAGGIVDSPIQPGAVPTG
jgi:hypothetical protein